MTFYLVEQNHLCNCGRECYKEYICEIILNLEQWFRRRRHLKIFIYSSGGPFVRQSQTICAILVEDIMRNIYVKLFLNSDQ